MRILKKLLLACVLCFAGGASSYAQTAPDAPGNVTSAAVSSSQVNLSWSDNSNNETGFQAFVSDTGWAGPYDEVLTFPADSTSAVLSDRAPNTTYHIYFYAFNGVGYSSEAYAPVTTPEFATAPVLPTSPGSFTATADSPTQISLSWTDRSDNEIGFRAYISKVSCDGPYDEELTFAVNATSAVLTNRTPNTPHFIYLFAFNDVGYSREACAEVKTLANELVVPPAPSDLEAARVRTTDIALAWTDNSNGLASFKIERSPDCATWTLIHTTAPGVRSFLDGGLARGTSYCYRVRATGEAGDSDSSNTAGAWTR